MVTSQALYEIIEKLSREICLREGLLFYDLQMGRDSSGSVVRLYIDKGGGATVDDCAIVSKALNLQLDVEAPMGDSPYNLEVSTPGLERHLSRKEHFEWAIGKLMQFRLKAAREIAVEGKTPRKIRESKGTLEQVEGSSFKVILDLTNDELVINFDELEKAHLVFEMVSSKGVKKETQKKRR